MSQPEVRAALDTSVVMRLLTGQPQDLATAARSYMAEVEQAGAKVLVSNLVVMEAYFACQHHYGMPKASVLAGLRTLLAMPTFVVHPQLPGLLSLPDLATAKPGFLDRLIHAEAAGSTCHSSPSKKPPHACPAPGFSRDSENALPRAPRLRGRPFVASAKKGSFP